MSDDIKLLYGRKAELLEKSFLDLITQLNIYEDLEASESFARQLIEVVNKWTISRPALKIDLNQLIKLQTVLKKYHAIFEDGFTKDHIMRAFTYKSKGATIGFQKLEGEDKVRVLNYKNFSLFFLLVFFLDILLRKSLNIV